MRKSITGFTVVELLIVIGVIAILATISMMAFRGIQQRANNTAIIDAASKSLRAVEAYITANGTYPVSGAPNNSCVTTTSGCIGESGAVINANATFETAIATISTLPRSVPATDATHQGVYFNYNASITVEGDSRPLLLVYYLAGNNQKCSLDNIVLYQWPNLSLSTLGYSSSSGGTTRCWISVPGPSA